MTRSPFGEDRFAGMVPGGTGIVLIGDIFEEYPEDKPYPSCLVYGETFKKEPIHSVWGIMKRINGWS
jgi:hypothetical protein